MRWRGRTAANSRAPRAPWSTRPGSLDGGILPVRPRRDARVYAARPPGGQRRRSESPAGSSQPPPERSARQAPIARDSLPPSSAASPRSEGPAELFGMTDSAPAPPRPRRRALVRRAVQVSRSRVDAAARGAERVFRPPCPAERPRERGAADEPSSLHSRAPRRAHRDLQAPRSARARALSLRPGAPSARLRSPERMSSTTLAPAPMLRTRWRASAAPTSTSSNAFLSISTTTQIHPPPLDLRPAGGRDCPRRR